MGTTDTLLERFARTLGDRHAAALAGGLADRLATGLAAARAQWPQAPVDDLALADHIASRLAKQPDIAAAVARLPVEDLVLAWWAGSGDSAGIAAFEAAFAEDIDRLTARFRQLHPDDLRQRLRMRLFVGTAASPPKLRDYGGSGSLAGWLRVTASRVFVDAVRLDTRRRYEVELDEMDLLGMPAPGGSLREQQQRAEVTAAIKHAFADVVSRLAPRERTFLRHATVDNLTLEQIAATYGVHRATVARTLKSARERLLVETRAAVAVKLAVEPTQLEDALALLDSRLDLSLSRILHGGQTRP